MIGHEPLIEATSLVEQLQGRRREGKVATDAHGYMQVTDPGAEDRRLRQGGNPVALESGLQIGIDDHDLGPAFLGQVEVLGEHRLVGGGGGGPARGAGPPPLLQSSPYQQVGVLDER